MAASEVRFGLLLLGLLALASTAQAQSANDVERCFQNPGACSTSHATPPASGGGGGGGGVAAARPGPDYASVLQRPDAERKRIQESLRTLDKYNGPIDGNIQSDGTVKAIADWQKGRGTAVTGKLTPDEVQTLHAEASKAPIKRIEPPAQAAAPPPPSNADLLKALQAKQAERRKAAEPKAEAAGQILIKDLKAYVAAEGKTGAVGDQFTYFSTWLKENFAVGRAVSEISPVVEDYGDAKGGSAVSVEAHFELKQSEKKFMQCIVFAWINVGPSAARSNARSFACDDVAGVEKWKSEQALNSAWR